ncbi:MAG: carbamoyl-phosphate-synthetase [Gammaproteobacteria bacterium SG8_47]|nr:MAG: carbamoyl-phosphate-synthetase [Gammaproteobacteria bacterium SG8_47]
MTAAQLASVAGVAVTGMNARADNPGPGVAVARCLREGRHFSGRIVGLGYDPLDPGVYLEQFCDAGYLLPYPSAGDEAFLDRIAFIHDEQGFDLMIPTLDAELPGLVRLAPKLADMGVRTFLPSATQLELRNKDRLGELAEHAGMIAPETKKVTQAGFFYRCQEEGWTYPLVVKGLFYDAQVARDPDTAAAAFHRIAAQWGFPVLVQRFLRGEEVNLTALGDGEGNLLGPVMMRKLGLTDKGKAWAGVTVQDDRLLEASQSLVAATRWRGPLEVEVMVDDEGRYQLIEINPRFPAWIYLAAGVGRNLPEALVSLAFGQQPDKFIDVAPGTLFIRYAQETIVPLSEYESVVMRGVRRQPMPHADGEDATGVQP